MIFGTACKTFRRQLGLTQTELAEATGLSLSGIYQFESGKRNNFEMLETLCKFFGIPVWKVVKALEESSDTPLSLFSLNGEE